MSKTKYNERFAEVYYSLLRANKVNNKKSLGNAIGTWGHVVNDLMHGGRQPTLAQITSLVKNFGINANYIFSKSETMYISQIKAVTFNSHPPESKP